MTSPQGWRSFGNIGHLDREGYHSDCILRSHQPALLGDLLPFVAEFWRSSMTVLFSRVLESPFPSKLMRMPYKAPVHWRDYEAVLRCPVEFSCGELEWHFDASVMDRPLPNANKITFAMCRAQCEGVLQEEEHRDPQLAEAVRKICTASEDTQPGSRINWGSH